MDACPIVLVRRDGAIAARYVPVRKDFNVYGCGHLESMEPLAEVVERLGAINGYPDDGNSYVVNVRRVERVHCGGEVVWQLLVAKSDMERFERWQTHTVYISNDNGKLRVAIPA